jgi:NAD-dependent SIR2 family protein deacetylase
MCLNETCSKICIGSHFSDSFSIQNCLNKEMLYHHCSLQLCFQICHQKYPAKPGGAEMNGMHQFLAYSDDVNLMGDNIDTINKNAGTSTDASKEAGLEINREKIRYRLLA